MTFQGCWSPGGQVLPPPLQISADELTLLKSGGRLWQQHYKLPPSPVFSNLHTALHLEMRIISKLCNQMALRHLDRYLQLGI